METKSGAEKEEKLESEKRGQIEDVYIHSIVVKRLQRELLSFYALISLKINSEDEILPEGVGREDRDSPCSSHLAWGNHLHNDFTTS